MKQRELFEIIRKSSNIVFFGGAGVSTESGIPDFRSSQGLYASKSDYKYEPEKILSQSFFEKHPEEFFSFYKEKMIYIDAEPNKAHTALRRLEEMGKLKGVITQNIDGLHQMAGTKKVIELHGSIHRNYCTKCGSQYNLEYIINSKTFVPYCEKCGRMIKPDVVLYEEALDEDTISEAVHLINNAEVLIVGGTSLVVYPAAGLIRYYRGDKLVLINKSSTNYDNVASLVINDSIGAVLEDLINHI